MGTFLPLPLASCSSAFFPELQLNQHIWSMQAASWGKEERYRQHRAALWGWEEDAWMQQTLLLAVVRP